MSLLPPSSGAARAFSVPPLTCSGRDGKRYQRRADIETKIVEMVQKRPSEWLESADSIPAEVLVYLIRAIADDDRGLAGDLIHRLSRTIQSVARRWAKGFSQDKTEEIIEAVTGSIIELVLAERPSRQSEFLEMAFSRKVKGKTLNEVAKSRPFSQVSLSGKDETTLEVPDERINTLEALLKNEGLELLRKAEGKIRDPRHFEALVLRYGYDWPIESEDPAEPTLSKKYNVSARQIRNWIVSGLETLRAALGVKL
jgi:hypothetical protein